MPRLTCKVPSYRRHASSGQAIVTIDHRDHYLGLHGSPESKEKYNRLVGEYLANGRRLPSPDRITMVSELILAFWSYAKTHYRHPDGSPTSELSTFKQILRALRQRYGSEPVTAFRPLSLKALRDVLVTKGWSRGYINAQISRIKTAFKWGVAQELVPPGVLDALQSVPGLQAGRSDANETPRVQKASEEIINAVKPHVSRQVWALIQLQLLTGARPGELLLLRPVDLDTSDKLCWVTRLEQHKTLHHGLDRRIMFGARAQEVLKPFLEQRSSTAYLFSPAEAEMDRRARVHTARATPLSCGNRPGSKRVARPKRQPSDHYTVDSYRRAIARACEVAFPLPEELARKMAKDGSLETKAQWKLRLGPEQYKAALLWRKRHHFHPHQLRHNAATNLRSQFGLEVARAVLGVCPSKRQHKAATDASALLD